MKFKILLLVLFSFLFLKVSSQDVALNAWLGYSWLNGVLGGELVVGPVGLSGGWVPAKMPRSGDRVNSFGGSLTIYSSSDPEDSAYYISGGISTAGYREETYIDGSYYSSYIEPMYIVMAGARYSGIIWSLKIGLGWGSYSDGGAFTWETGISIRLF